MANKQELFKHTDHKVIEYVVEGNEIVVYKDTSGDGFDISSMLEGTINGISRDINPSVVIRFGTAFEKAKGLMDGKLLTDGNVVVLSHLPNQDHLQNLLGEIDKIALLGIDASEDICKEYSETARTVYNELLNNSEKLGFQSIKELEDMNKLSLWRAGPVSTRMFLGIDSNVKVSNEIGINVKRVHFKGDQEGEMNVLVYLQDTEKLRRIHNKPLLIVDWALATGASNLAVLLALKQYGIIPSSVHIRPGVFAPKAVPYILKVLKEIGINKVDIFGAGAGSLNEKYYLEGMRIGDAGDFFDNAGLVPDIEIID